VQKTYFVFEQFFGELFMKKAQSSLEYLTTYGWAILAIIGVIGVMAYAGIGDVTDQIPTRCDLGAKLNCGSFYGLSSGDYAFEFTNYNSGAIIITGYICMFPGMDNGLYFNLTSPARLAVGAVGTVLCNGSDLGTLNYAGKQVYDVKIFYELDETMALPKIISGDIVIGVTDNDVLFQPYINSSFPTEPPLIY